MFKDYTCINDNFKYINIIFAYVFTKSQLNVLLSVMNGHKKPSEISASTGISIAQVYKVADSLEKIGLISKGKEVSITRTPLAASLAGVFQYAPNVPKSLSSNGAEILSALDVPRTVPEICDIMGLDQSRTYTKIRELYNRSMVKKEGRSYSVNTNAWPVLIPFVKDYRRYLEMNPSSIPVTAKIYCRRDNGILFRCPDPKGYQQTAFSAYGEFGIDITPNGYYCSTIEETPTLDTVFRDSLCIISKENNWRLRMFALILYCKYRDRITVPDSPVMDEIRDVLDGRVVRGWVPLSEMQDRAKMYGVELV